MHPGSGLHLTGPRPDVRVFPSLDALSRDAAAEVASAARDAVTARGRCTIALAGGSTPQSLYERLGGEHRACVPWSRLHVLFGDERCVPPSHPDSNFAMARSSLFVHVPLPGAQIHPVPVDRLPPDAAAAAYEHTLRQLFGVEAAPVQAPSGAPLDAGSQSPLPASTPSFDLVLLGVGADGHTASLFPASPALEERERWVVPVEGPAYVTPRCRVTLTLPVINRARTVFFLCAGAEKRVVVRSILEEAGRVADVYPAGRVRAGERLVWFVDREAFPSG